MTLVEINIQINFPLINISISTIKAEILTSSITPQTHKQSVTITFKHRIYTQICTTPVPLPSPTPQVPIPLPPEAQAMYMKLQIFTAFQMLTWSLIMLIDKIVMQTVNTTLTTSLQPLPIKKSPITCAICTSSHKLTNPKITTAHLPVAVCHIFLPDEWNMSLLSHI
jgi:hypothetical protein